MTSTAIVGGTGLVVSFPTLSTPQLMPLNPNTPDKVLMCCDRALTSSRLSSPYPPSPASTRLLVDSPQSMIASCTPWYLQTVNNGTRSYLLSLRHPASSSLPLGQPAELPGPSRTSAKLTMISICHSPKLPRWLGHWETHSRTRGLRLVFMNEWGDFNG
jgi:hypothetical protein